MPANKVSLWLRELLTETQLPFEYLTETSSTNLLAKAQAFQTDFKIFLTEKQQAGRGTKGRTWQDSDLMITCLFTRHQIKNLKNLDIKFTEDIHACCQEIWPKLPWKIKKPNDIYLQDKKVAGLLVEILEQPPQVSLIVGLGFNVLRPAPLPEATSLKTWNKEVSKKDFQNFFKKVLACWQVRLK